jgi:hypothetical protein
MTVPTPIGSPSRPCGSNAARMPERNRGALACALPPAVTPMAGHAALAAENTLGSGLCNPPAMKDRRRSSQAADVDGTTDSAPASSRRLDG